MKQNQKRYSVKFAIKAIVSLEVNAETPEQAIKIAQEEMKKLKTFNPKLDYLDGSETVCGYDDNDLWNEVI